MYDTEESQIMKVSYIIMPFEDAEYLIRCVNSLYRQLGEDYEVILAENGLDGGSVEFLAEKPQVKRISEDPYTAAEKLSEAGSMLAEDCAYVQLVNVDTVVSPIMARAVLGCEKSDLVVPAIAVRKGDGFVVDAPETASLVKTLTGNPPERFCFDRGLFAEVSADHLSDFPSFMLLKCAENITIKMLGEVCAYTEPVPGKPTSEGTISESSLPAVALIERLPMIRDSAIRFSMANMLMDGLLTELDEEKHSALCLMSEKCGGDVLLNRLFEGKSGCGLYEFAALTLSEYRLLTAETNRDILDRVNRQRQQLDELQKSLGALKKEAAALNKLKIVIPAAQAAVMGDPAVEVPRMYREGRLGFKTIWRSFWGWMKFKLVGNVQASY